MVKKHHYSNRAAGSPVVSVTEHEPGGLFGTRGDAVAACIFSSPPTRWSYPILELSRLVRTPEYVGTLSRLVAFATREALKVVPVVVSFADATQGHHGGIYQASGWSYHGQREPANDGLIIDGVFVPGRTCNRWYGTRSADKVSALLGRPVQKHYDDGKHLYWKASRRGTRAVISKLALTHVEYPKPAKKPANG